MARYNRRMRHRNIKQKIGRIPVVGYSLRLIRAGFNLPITQSQQALRMDKAALDSKALRQDLTTIQGQVAIVLSGVEESNKVQSSLSNQLADIKHQLTLLAAQPTKKPVGKKQAATPSSQLFVDNHALDKFYLDFEDRFRGTEEDIKERLQVYVPYLKKLKSDTSTYPVLDIGCGRGEMLEVLKQSGINGLGLDLNESMVNRAKKLGYNAIQQDALSFLMEQKGGSFAAVTGFHIVEHIPFDVLLKLLEECYRVLRPGGFIIFETPNPESIHVGSFSFYFDPSHLNPIPPDILAFAAENRGFGKVDILRLHPRREDYKTIGGTEANEDTKEVFERFFGPQDYAIVAYKGT